MTTSEKESLVSPMVEMDAREFGLHLKEGGWRLGLLVARSVEPGTIAVGGGGGGAVVAITTTGKTSASKFADDARTSVDRVMRYYRAWDRYATKGKVPPASDLTPGDEPDLDWTRLPKWSLSELPPDPGATGPLNLHIKLGTFGSGLARTHRRFRTFMLTELPEAKPGRDVRSLAGKYAACLEADASLLRKIEANEELPNAEELTELLDLSHYFEVER